ncbi:MAG: hypothetical protein NY202_02910 [Mollicutes bacterium UO1]
MFDNPKELIEENIKQTKKTLRELENNPKKHKRIQRLKAKLG